nr:hypothetical protein [Microbacterium sp. MRS-1]
MAAEHTTYDTYLNSLATLRNAPDKHKDETRVVAATYDQSIVYANRSVEQSQERFERGQAAIERHLKNATNFLAKVDEASRIPPRIKPSVVPASATGTEVDTALQQLAQTTSSLGIAVDRLVAQQSQPAPEVRTGVAEKPVAPPVRKFSRGLLYGMIGGGALILITVAIVLLTR